jgi:biopolymer transport protein ExbD
MKFSNGKRAKAPALALTSMLDVIFLLLCFFVTASVFSQWESEISISLPSAASAETPGRLPGEVILNDAKDGSVIVNARRLTLQDLGARLRKVAEFYPGQPVVIRADGQTAYSSLVAVIDTCRNAGVWNFSLATVEEKESGK